MSGPRPRPQQGLCFAQRSPHTYGTAMMGAGSRATSPTLPGSTAWVPVATEPCACQAQLGSVVDPTCLLPPVGRREDGEGLFLPSISRSWPPAPPGCPFHAPLTPVAVCFHSPPILCSLRASDLTQLTSPERHLGTKYGSHDRSLFPLLPQQPTAPPRPPHLPAGWGLTGPDQRMSTGRWPWFCPQ